VDRLLHFACNRVCGGCRLVIVLLSLALLAALALAASQRMIGVSVFEWGWDLKRLVQKHHRWETQQWISSGFDEPAAQRVRGQTFRRALQQSSAGSAGWLRRLHRSHSPERGPFSTCMHRDDAATVSHTDVICSSRHASMNHHVGSPCSCKNETVHRIDFRPPTH
jgi:hypothetical protein